MFDSFEWFKAKYFNSLNWLFQAQYPALPYQNKIKAKHRNDKTPGKHIRAMYTPFEPHFYIAKLGFAGVTYFSYFCSKT